MATHRSHASTRRALALLAAALLAACGSKSAAPGPAAPVEVGAAGGTVPGPEGVAVVVPPDATPTPVAIQVTKDATGAPAAPTIAAPASAVFAVLPHGTAFTKPVKVRIPFDPSQVPAGAQPMVAKASPGGTWVLHQAVVKDGAFLEVEVMSFSYFLATSTGTTGIYFPSVALAPPRLTMVPTPGLYPDRPFVSLPGHAGAYFVREFDRPETVSLTFTLENMACPDGTPSLYVTPQHIGPGYLSLSPTTLAVVGDPNFAELRFDHPEVNGWTVEIPVPNYPHVFTGDVLGEISYGQIAIGATYSCRPRSGAPPVALASQDAIFMWTQKSHQLGIYRHPPRTTSVAAGSAANFEVWATAAGPLTVDGPLAIEWERSDNGRLSWSVARSEPLGGLRWGNWGMPEGIFARHSLPAVTSADQGAVFRARICATDPTGRADCVTSAETTVQVTSSLPFFIMEPRDLTAHVGDALTLAVAAGGGAPPLSYHWFQRFNSSSPPALVGDGAILAFSELAATGLTLFAEVTDGLGQKAQSRDVQVTILPATGPAAPTIASQPASLTLPAGSEAVFAVAATGSAPLAFQWSKDGTVIPGAVGPVFIIPAIAGVDAGLYTVTVSNGVSPAATSVPARLTVVSAPVIVTQPASVTLNTGQAASFGVTATGIGTLSYQWMKNGVSIPGATGPLYATPPTVSGDSGAVFSVAIWNTAGAVVSDGAVLTVVVPPPPAVVSVTPSHGPTSGGTPIAIAGSGFQSGATVTVGGAPATSVSFVSAASLTATTPPGAPGAASVVVKNPDAQIGTAAGAYTYELVTLSVLSASPVGTGLQAGAASVAVSFSSPLDCGPVTGTSLQVFEAAVQVPGTVGCSGSVLTFQPSPALPTLTSLRGHVDPAVRSLAGATLGAAYDWTFGMAPWTRQLGGSAQDQANAVAVDPAGNLFAVGDTFGGLDGNPLVGIFDAFAVKYSAAGAKLWTRQLGVAGALTQGRGAAADAAGNLYVVGSTSGNLDGMTNAGSSDAFVVKYDAAGVKQWTRLLGTAAGEVAHAVATDAAGNVYVAGFTGGNLDGNTSAGLDDLFVAKLDGAGTRLWTRQLGSSEADQARAVAVDGAGDVYVAGTTQGGLDGNVAAGPNTTVDGFLVKYSAAGVKQWTRQLGTSADDWTRGVATDAAGNAYVAGQTYGSLDGNPNAGPAGTSDAFLVKYDAAGVKQWTRQLGSAATDGLNAVAVDGSGAVFVAGGTNGAIEAGSTNSAGTNLLVARYDAAGTQSWLHQRGSGAATNDGALGVTADAFGSVFLGGITSGGLDGNASAGSFDAYVVKYGADGTQR